MNYACNIAYKKIMRILGIKSLIIRVIDNITYADTKTQMFMAIFSLHTKYFEVVDFDDLFFDTLDTLFNIEIYSNYCSYLNIATEISINNEITEDELRNVLLNWIYNEPFLKHLIILETPQAEVEIQSVLTDATMI